MVQAKAFHLNSLHVPKVESTLLTASPLQSSMIEKGAFPNAHLPANVGESTCQGTHSPQKACPVAQDFVSEAQVLAVDLQDQTLSSSPHNPPQGELYIFVSFSLGEKALLNLAHEAKQYGASLVLRGFKQGSYRNTVKALEKIIAKTGMGFSIDPELFDLFQIKVVPTYILAKPFPPQATDRVQTPIHDRLRGHVSVLYALESFAKEGDLKNEAQDLLDEKNTQEVVP